MGKRTLRMVMLIWALATASAAQGQTLLDRSEHYRPQMLSFFVGTPYYYYGYRGAFPVGFGLRYYIPILRDGFVPRANDEFGIEFGGDFALYNYDGAPAFYGLSIPVEVLWDFHLMPRFDAYLKLGAAFSVGIGNYAPYVPAPFGVYPVSAVGLRFHVASWFYLRAEVGYPWAKVGFAFAF
jgi:hypothetical protein